MAQPDTDRPVFSRRERIQKLNEIDQDLSSLVRHAATALQSLVPGSTASNTAASRGLPARQQQFQTAAADYFATLSSIDVNLRRQIYALEEQGILAIESRSKDSANAKQAASGTPGLGLLDVAWLNGRAHSDQSMEAESWSRLAALLADERVQRVLSRKAEAARKKSDTVDAMQIDSEPPHRVS